MPDTSPLDVQIEHDVTPEDIQGRSLELLARVRAGEQGPTLRMFVPQATVEFGRRDTRLPGFAAAQDAARRHGFVPVVRSVGGRAAAFDSGTLIVDHLVPEADAVRFQERRFIEFGAMFVDVLERVGVMAAVGEIPGEYCPGPHSVHGIHADGSRVKLVGTAQRVVTNAWLFSSSIIVHGSDRIRAVTTDVYAALGLDLDPATVGAVEDVQRTDVPLSPKLLTEVVADVWGAR